MRLLYSIGYGFIAWFVLHILFFLAVVQVVMIAINGRANEELKRFARTLIQYECGVVRVHHASCATSSLSRSAHFRKRAIR